MEDNKRKEAPEKKESDIIFSKAIKAGKRIYYLDVKRNKKDDLYLAITESKKINYGTAEEPNVQFEKHKIFLYKEDFDKFANGLEEVLYFIKDLQNTEEEEVPASNFSTEDYGKY